MLHLKRVPESYFLNTSYYSCTYHENVIKTLTEALFQTYLVITSAKNLRKLDLDGNIVKISHYEKVEDTDHS